MYGYFYVKPYKNPNKNFVDITFIINETSDYFKSYYNVDRILYDYKQKPSNPNFDNFLDLLLYYIKENDTVVVRSLFQLGNTKVDIYESLRCMRAKQVKLIVNKWEVDISSTMQKVLELSVNDLVVYENLEFYMNHCSDYTNDYNYYRKLAGYILNESYIKKETTRRIHSLLFNKE